MEDANGFQFLVFCSFLPRASFRALTPERTHSSQTPTWETEEETRSCFGIRDWNSASKLCARNSCPTREREFQKGKGNPKLTHSHVCGRSGTQGMHEKKGKSRGAVPQRPEDIGQGLSTLDEEASVRAINSGLKNHRAQRPNRRKE